MQVVRRALEQKSYIEAFFFDFASLYQHPPGGGMRTPREQESFSRAIGVMGDLYASAIGTTVLQIKEIPERPDEFHGALCLFDLKKDVDESQIKKALEVFGTIQDKGIEIGGWPSAVVRFSTHEGHTPSAQRLAATSCSAFALEWTLYNERSYDGRHKDEAGRDDDEGRGW